MAIFNGDDDDNTLNGSVTNDTLNGFDLQNTAQTTLTDYVFA